MSGAPLARPPLLPAPRAWPDVAADTTAPQRGRYRREYALEGPPDSWLVQQVTTRVRYLRGDVVVLELRAAYGEAFRLGAGPARDIHDFDLHRDGWSAADVGRLLRRHAADVGAGGPPRVECLKTYLLGPGRVDGVEPLVATDDGGAFAYLAEGPAGAPRVELRVAGEPIALDPPPSPFPFASPAAGGGRFTTARGYAAREVFHYRFATLSGRLDDGGGYRPAPTAAGADERGR